VSGTSLLDAIEEGRDIGATHSNAYG